MKRIVLAVTMTVLPCATFAVGRLTAPSTYSGPTMCVLAESQWHNAWDLATAEVVTDLEWFNYGDSKFRVVFTDPSTGRRSEHCVLFYPMDGNEKSGAVLADNRALVFLRGSGPVRVIILNPRS